MAVVVVAALLLAWRHWHLRQTADVHEEACLRDRDRLAGLYLALRAFVSQHGRPPRALSELPNVDADGWVYRELPAADCDEKLLVAHDDAARRKIVEFPSVRLGRLVLFWSGRVRLVTESAFEKLIAADDAVRERAVTARSDSDV